ncbi:MAG: actin-binding WH2 domain-containing protein [Anaerolineae bacterium]
MRDLAVIEPILRNRHHYFVDIRDGVGIPEKMRAMVLSSLVCFLIAGAVLGSTHSVLQALSSAIKLPILFLATLVITSPTLYFFQILFGSNQSLVQSIALILTAITVTAVLLVSFAPISLFFLVTTSNYQFFKLLNVVIFAVAGLRGISFLSEGVRIVAASPDQSRTRRGVVRLWVILYALVGTQMAWALRPFVGAPSLPFELFRSLGGNFYSNVFASLGEILGFWMVR